MDDIDTGASTDAADGEQTLAPQTDQPTAQAEPDAGPTLEGKINAAVQAWFSQHIHGSAVSRATEAYNHLHASLDDLKAAIVQAVKE